MIKNLKIILVMFLLSVVLFGCKDNHHEIPVDETPSIEVPEDVTYDSLDGTYYLVQSIDAKVNLNQTEKMDAPYQSYELTIQGNQLKEVYTLHGITISKEFEISILNNEFSIIDDNRRFAFNIEEGTIEIQVLLKNSLGGYYVFLAKDNNKEITSTSLDGYYMVEEVIGNQGVLELNHAFFSDFTLDFSKKDQVTVLKSIKGKVSETFVGTYTHTRLILLITHDDEEMLFFVKDDLLIYFYNEPTVGQAKYSAYLSHQEDKLHPIYEKYTHRNLDYSNSTFLKEELRTDLEEKLILFDYKYFISEAYITPYGMNIYPYVIDGSELFVILDDQIIYYPDYINSMYGLIIQDDYVYGTAISSTYPSYDIVDSLDHQFFVAKNDSNHYMIRVNLSSLKNNHTIFSRVSEYLPDPKNYIGDFYIEIELEDSMVSYQLYDETMNLLAVVAYSKDIELDLNLIGMKQDVATEIESAIIPMVIGETYTVDVDDFIPYKNYYKLELKKGFYEVSHTESRVDIELLNIDYSLSSITKNHSLGRSNRFSFEIKEDQTIYLEATHDSYYNQGYDITVKELIINDNPIVEVDLGETYDFEIDSIFNPTIIRFSETNPQAYHVIFTPSNKEDVYLEIGNVGILYLSPTDIIDEVYMMDANEELLIYIRTSGTIKIEHLEDDPYQSSKENPYALNDMTDETFVASSSYPEDVFIYQHIEGMFTIDTSLYVTAKVYDEFMNEQTLPISTVGTYYVVVPTLHYDHFYTTYQIKVLKMLSETMVIDVDTYFYQGYYAKDHPQKFEFTLTEKSRIELKSNQSYGLNLYLKGSNNAILENIEDYMFTLTAGEYLIVYDSYQNSHFTLSFTNFGESDKPAINEEISSKPITITLTFDSPNEIFMFHFSILDNEYISVQGNAYFFKYDQGYTDEMKENIRYGYSNLNVYIIVMQKDVTTPNIKIFTVFL